MILQARCRQFYWHVHTLPCWRQVIVTAKKMQVPVFHIDPDRNISIGRTRIQATLYGILHKRNEHSRSHGLKHVSPHPQVNGLFPRKPYLFLTQYNPSACAGTLYPEVQTLGLSHTAYTAGYPIISGSNTRVRFIRFFMEREEIPPRSSNRKCGLIKI